MNKAEAQIADLSAREVAALSLTMKVIMERSEPHAVDSDVDIKA